MSRISCGEDHGNKAGRVHREPRAVRAMQGGYGDRMKDRKPFVCSVCQETFRAFYPMVLHRREKHEST